MLNYVGPIVIKRKIKNEMKRIGSSQLFDRKFYKKYYNVPFGTDPLAHFCSVGWRRDANPSRYFDTAYYRSLNKDVRDHKVNPLIHYLQYGGHELRKPAPEFDPQEFCDAHPQAQSSDLTPAEFCISLYKTYDWMNGSEIIDEVSPSLISEISKIFDKEFYDSMNPEVSFSEKDSLHHFVVKGQYENRDPSPEIDISYYRKSIKSTLRPSENPLLHFVRHRGAQPSEPLDPQSLILDASSKRRLDHKFNLCVHVHCFYPELIAELLPGLMNFPADAKIILTAISEADGAFIKSACFRWMDAGRVDVRVVPNRGRDLGPLLVGCKDVWQDFDIVLHLHTKKSPHVAWGDAWRQYLFDQTLGSSELVQAVIEQFANNNSLGCLYPRNFCLIRRFVEKEANVETIQAVLARGGYETKAVLYDDYPAGSMAWYRADALRSFVGHFDSIEAFDEEDGQLDLTVAHALERALPLAVNAAGYQVRNYVTRRRKRIEPFVGLPQRESSQAPVPPRWQRDTPRIARQAPLKLEPLYSTFNQKRLDIHWIVPSFAQGAGGHMTIFRMVKFLESFGHRQTVWLQNAVQFSDQEQARQRIRTWYQPIGDRVHVRFLPDDIRELSGDALIATDCWTAFPAALAQNFKDRFYFVQDYEPYFHPAGELQLLAETTYNFGFPTLCAGAWLHGLMGSRGHWSRQWDLCADRAYYFPGLRRAVVGQTGDHNPFRVAFYCRPYTPRRAVTLGLAAFELLKLRGFDFHVDLFGEADVAIDYDFPCTQHGILNPQQLGELYRSCDIGVVFSATNYSLIPLEMMACDLPVVELDTESTRAIFKDGEVTFTNAAPYQIADAITSLVSDSERKERQRRQARAFLADLSWERSARSVEAAILERLTERGFRGIELGNVAAPAIVTKPKVSVFIPIYNAGADFSAVMKSVTTQRCDFRYETLLIDSGSSDETLEIARDYRSHGVRIETIPNASFQHGRTRNMGIELAEGAYVALLTQDAQPKDDSWLAALIGGFAKGPRVGGVIGRHEAYPHHDAFTKRDLTAMFDSFALLPSVIDAEIGLPSYIYPGGRTWRMLMQFYSDNNSAVCKEVWKIIPYPEINWGEDQVWAENMLRLGFQKAYVNEAVVYHSHAFDVQHQRKVSLTEGKFWGQFYGLNLHEDVDASIAAMDEHDRLFALRTGIDRASLKYRQTINRAVVEGRAAGYADSLSMNGTEKKRLIFESRD